MPEKSTKTAYIYALYLLGNVAAAMTWPVTTLYLTNYLGRTYSESGIVLMIGALISMLASYAGGLMFDRWKPKLSLVISIVISLISMTLMFFFHTWPVYALFLWTNNIGFGIQQTTLNSYAAVIGRNNPKKFFSNMAIVLNIGVVIGTFAGTYLFGHLGIHGTMTFGIVILAVMTILSIIGIQEIVHTRQALEKKVRLRPNRLLLSIGFLLLVSYMTYQFWETVMSPHMVDLGMSVEQFGYLWVINGAIIIFFQSLVTRFTDGWSYRKSTFIGITIFAVSFLPLIWANEFWEMVLSFVLLTIGEMFFSPVISAWITTIVGGQFQGQGMAFSSASISLGRAVGPLYAGLFMDRGWIAALFGGVFVLIMVAQGLVALASQKQKTQTEN
jgi:predicted MFS family arabinose efflux permease